jgi:tRNA G18 (ribose-2'-O)-methylase SpoU
VPVIRITDPADERLGDYVALTDVVLRSRHEPEAGLYIAESTSVIRRALEAGHRPRSFLMSARWLDAMSDVLETAGAGPSGDVPAYVGDTDVVNAVAGFNVHRGALAAMHRPTLLTPSDLIAALGVGPRTVVVLEDIVDHTNVGAIFRSVAGLGADAVLVSSRCADPLYRRSVRDQGMQDLRAAGFIIAALALADDSQSLDDFVAHRPDRVALVLGAEGDGLSKGAIAGSDIVVRIPMSGGVDSLNVAAASAVALWAVRR